MNKVATAAVNALASLALLCALAPAGARAADAPASAPAGSDALRAQTLLKKALAHYRLLKDKAFPDFDREREFVDRELYVYVVSSATGVLLASGGPSFALVNRNVADLEDATGKAFFREMIAKAKADGAGTVEYLWLDPADNKEERKQAYFERVDDRIIAVGYYKR